MDKNTTAMLRKALESEQDGEAIAFLTRLRKQGVKLSDITTAQPSQVNSYETFSMTDARRIAQQAYDKGVREGRVKALEAAAAKIKLADHIVAQTEAKFAKLELAELKHKRELRRSTARLGLAWIVAGVLSTPWIFALFS